jgi:O-antigen/teichoic acid export membrane protein
MIKNSLYNASIALCGPVVSLLSLPIALKALGAYSFGEASIAISLIAYFQIVTSLGLTVYGTRELAAVQKAKDHFSTTFSELTLLSICSSFIGASIYIILSVFVLHSPAIIVTLGALTISLGFLNIEWFFFSLENYKIIALSNIASRLIGLILIFVFVNGPADIAKYVSIMTLATLLPAALVFQRHTRYAYISFNGLHVWRHFKAIGVFLSIRVLSSVYAVLDTVIVGFIAGPSVAGLYTVSIRIARIVCSLVCSMTSVAMPRASALHANSDRDCFYELLVNNLAASILLSSAALVCTLFFSGQIVLFLGGNIFETSGSALAILSLLIPIVSLSNFIGMQILYPTNNEVGVNISLVFGSLSYIISALVLVRILGLIGASLSSLVSEFFILVVQLYIARKSIASTYLTASKRLNRVIFLTLAMYLCCYLVFLHLAASSIPIAFLSVVTILSIYSVALFFAKESLVCASMHKFLK